MKVNLLVDTSTNEIVARLTTEDLRNRLESAVFDRIATKLADKYVEMHGEYILHSIIDVTALKEEVTTIIKQRLLDETSAKVQK